jgi:subtilisin family serine protease
MRGLAAVSLLVLLAFPGAVSASAHPGPRSYAPHELIVRFERGSTRAERNHVLAEIGARVLQRSTRPGLLRVRLGARASVERTAAELARRPEVARAQPNHLYSIANAPNDPQYLDNTLWGLNKIHAPEAWDLTTGNPALTVAVVDTGVDYTHPDLAANVWMNPGEVGGDSLDNDGNGFVDDVQGWNFAGGVYPPRDPMDTDGHGTHVAGTVGGVGNNAVGVTGVNWNVKVMPLRAGDANGLSDFDIVSAFNYACANGAKVINGSFSGPDQSPEILSAINACPQALFVFAAGNETNNNDFAPSYPCSEPSANIVCVAATMPNDTLASFSNYGLSSVDLGAPGNAIWSTYAAATPPAQYAYMSGTSMASPHVAGAAALVLAQRPTLSPVELKRALVNSVDSVPALQGLVASGGRLNVFRAMSLELGPPSGLALATATPTPGVWTNNGSMSVSWGGVSDPSGIDGFSYAVSADGAFVPDEVKDVEENVTSYSASLPDGVNWFHVRARDNAGNWSDPLHVGPFLVDSFAPPRPTLASPSHRPGYASADHTVEITWVSLPDTPSGLDGFSYAWAKSPLVPVDQVKDTEEGTRKVTSPALGAGAWWFGIRARDNAGNWTDTATLGPFVITNVQPVCSVPRLRGLTIAAVKRQLAKGGCALGAVGRAYSRRVKRGRVIAQHPAPGARLRRGAKVGVTVSRGRARR